MSHKRNGRFGSDENPSGQDQNKQDQQQDWQHADTASMPQTNAMSNHAPHLVALAEREVIA